MSVAEESLSESELCGSGATNGRQFQSPNRVLARSFRLSRDRWKQKHHETQAKLEQTRQLAAERGASRDQWRERCEQEAARATAAEATAEQLRVELAAAHARAAEAAPKKTR